MTLFFFVFACAKALVYWGLSAAIRPGESLAVHALYRAGDIQYFPLISALAHLRLGEFMLLESAGRSFFSYPPVPLALHAVCTALFGAAGYPAADVVVTGLFFLVLASFLRACGAPRLAAFGAAFLIVCASGDPSTGKAAFAVLDHALFPIEYHAVRMWGLRLMRPFVTMLFFVWALRLFCPLRFSEEAALSRRRWAAFAAAAGLALQADFFSGFHVVLFAAAVFASAVVFHPLRKRLWTAVGTGMIVFAAVLSPFFAQRLSEHPDFPVRWGVVEISRTRPIFLDAGSAFLTLLFAGIAVFLTRALAGDGRVPESVRRVPAFLAFLVVSAWAALPVLCMTTGKVIQIHHFQTHFEAVFSLAVLTLVLAAAGAALRLAAIRPSAALRAALAALFVAAGLAAACRTALPLVRYGGPMRRDVVEWELAGYRENFAELTRVLAEPRFADCRVLGTPDHQVSVWWLAFRDGRSFLADPFLSTAPDSEIERRLIYFCRLMGMDETRFRDFIKRPYVMIFWLSHDKYQASPLHTFSPIADYDAAARTKMAGLGPFNCWNLVLPRREEERLAAAFRGADTREAGRLDLVVLDSDPSLEGLAPPQDSFEAVFKNSSFRVWKRRRAG